MANRKTTYRYTDSGLDDVIIYDLEVLIDDEDEETVAIPNINNLHKTIARLIVSTPSSMTGKRLRFLRTEMGLTQDELGRMVHKDHQTVGRWERGETPIDGNAETLVRLITIDRLALDEPLSAEEISGLCMQTAETTPIEIDGSNPDNYQPKAA